MSTKALSLDYGKVLDDGAKSRIDNISAAVCGAGHLWTASDEGTTFERLTQADSAFANARSYKLEDYFDDYPPPGEDESDLEGLAFDNNRLWLMGSHALTRKNYGRLSANHLLNWRQPGRERARTLLGYVEVDTNGSPVAGSGRALPLGDVEGSLVSSLAEWDVLEEAARRPAKENGLDIEGLAVVGKRVFLGLRGPVIGPYAIVLEIEVATKDGSLEIVPVDGHRSRPHLIDTGGLGIRDLAMSPEGLILLAGPALDMEGPFEIYVADSPLVRWSTEPGEARRARFLHEIAIQRLPDRDGRLRGNRPEAIAVLDDALLVISERKVSVGNQSSHILDAALLTIPDVPGRPDGA